VLYLWERVIAGTGSSVVWSRIYWQEPWQTLGAISNSFPLWGLLFAIAVLARRSALEVMVLRSRTIGTVA